MRISEPGKSVIQLPEMLYGLWQRVSDIALRLDIVVKKNDTAFICVIDHIPETLFRFDLFIIVRNNIPHNDPVTVLY